MRNALFTLTFAVALFGCDDAAKTDTKTDGKTTTAKKEVRIPAKKGDAKTDAKADTKADAKVDAKADTKADVPPTGTPPDAEPNPAESIGKLASLAREIAAKPEAADSILDAAGMDRLAFEAAMVDVAKDQWKTDLYLTALSQPSQAG